MSKTLLMIARHGNTFAPGDTVTRVGRTDLPLVESGLEQGRRLGRYLKAAGLVPDVIFTSGLKRTIQTSEQAQAEMGTSLPARSLAIFNEIDYGPDENKPEEAVVARLGADVIKAWDTAAIVPNGWKIDPEAIVRNWKNFAADVLKNYAGKKVLVVTSNGIARFSPHLTGDFDGFRSTHSLKISTGALCIFEYDGTVARWVCKEWNQKPE
ncbi:MAG: histidine phosphatase family protein [Pseudomonadota bacterium]